jgi:hypothetical protein
MRVGGVQHGHAVTDAEKERLLEIDQRSWSKEETDKDGTFRRVDQAYVIDQFEGAPIAGLIERLIVPFECKTEAADLFGAKVEQDQL